MAIFCFIISYIAALKCLGRHLICSAYDDQAVLYEYLDNVFLSFIPWFCGIVMGFIAALQIIDISWFWVLIIHLIIGFVYIYFYILNRPVSPFNPPSSPFVPFFVSLVTLIVGFLIK